MTHKPPASSLPQLRYWFATLIRDHTKDVDRRTRMTWALARIKDQLLQDVSEDDLPRLAGEDPVAFAQQACQGLGQSSQGVAVLVELRSVHAFHPHVIQYDDETSLAALKAIARQASIPCNVETLNQLWREAARAFQSSDRTFWVKRLAGGAIVAGLLVSVLATAGATAPAIAATLATLGGGSVAVGGFGMVGGMAMLLLGGMTGGSLLSHTSQVLQRLGVEGLRAELIKLEVTQRLWWRQGVKGVPTRARVIEQQEQVLKNVERLLRKEQDISDRKTGPIKELTEMMELCQLSLQRFRDLT